MISDRHYIELYINKELMELESQDSINLRINNVIFNPTKTTTTQAEYSYSFVIPSTPDNDRILDYANNLSKTNKFHARYPSQVYADGHLIFNGSLTVQKYNASNKMYTCNLVNIKVNSLEDIFGDAVLTDIPWEVDFDGANTINEVNGDLSTKYWFPFVSYGVFQKNYISKDEVSADFTSKFDLDKYNKWWLETFYPSLNMVELMKKAFEWKGYEVTGNIFSDPNISNIYASCNLADGQVPIYNVGYQPMGSVHLTVNWNNYSSFNESFRYSEDNISFKNSTGGLQQDLNFPYNRVAAASNASNVIAGDNNEYNFATVQFWNMLDSTNNPNGVSLTMLQDSYIYEPTESVIVIPCSGWYRINLEVSATLSGAGTNFTASQWKNTFYEGDEFKKRDITLTRVFTEHTPLEIHLIKNYNDNIELIKGKKNIIYHTGDPSDETYEYKGGSYTRGTYPNKEEWDTDFPHQGLYGSKAPTKTEKLLTSTQIQDRMLINTSSWVQGSTTGPQGTFGGGDITRSIETAGISISNTYGYMHKDNKVMPYDPAVSTAFICGFSSLSDGIVSVMRNGRSWSRLSTASNKIFAEVDGMELVEKGENGEITYTPTNYCKNTYVNSPSNYCTSNSSTMQGQLHCCVWLEKNDIIELVAVQRDYDSQKYSTSATCRLDITAITDRTQAELLADPNWNINSDVEFSEKLRLTNFTNNETKVVDWINDVVKAFNLEIIQDANFVEINTNQGIKKNITYAVDVDDRVGSDEAVAEYISYPKEMSVKYKINTEEWGFERTVPEDKIDLDNWKDYGDSGYTVIKLNDDTYETSSQNTQTNFSYTWYDNFTWKKVNQDGTEDSGTTATITIPVIETSEYMADGYGYEEAMKHDGYGLTQRLWYRQAPSEQYVWLSDYMREKVWLAYPTNTRNRFNLSYKDSETSIVSEYFNIYPMLSSNYVSIEAFINPQEYINIKNGALVHYDSDLYYTSEISGFDPSGNNPTKLKLIKRI